MKWYLTLSIHKRIMLKQLSQDICGMPFHFLCDVFGFKDAIELLYEKLRYEGFDL